MMDCAEHGVPQTLTETEFPGAGPKGAVLFMLPRSKEAVAIAPVYGPDDIRKVILRGEELGLTRPTVITVYSPADLFRVQDADELPVSKELEHEPGCIYSDTKHPGKCYVEIQAGDHLL